VFQSWPDVLEKLTDGGKDDNYKNIKNIGINFGIELRKMLSQLSQVVPVNVMVGVTLRWSSIPSKEERGGGGRNIPGRLMPLMALPYIYIYILDNLTCIH